MPSSLLLICLLLLMAALAPTAPKSSAAPPTTAALKDCPRQCGSVAVPYPFGFRSGCYHYELKVECNSSSSSPMIRLSATSFQVVDKLVTVSNMSLDTVTAQFEVIVDCTSLNPRSAFFFTDLERSPYTVSYTRNIFVVLGCSSVALIAINKETLQLGQSCQSTCSNRSGILDGICSTTSGCCQAAIPKELRSFGVMVQRQNDTRNRAISPCSYAFIMDSQQYVFRSTDLTDYLGSRGISTVPAVLDWAIGNYTCGLARTLPDYACGANAYCVDSTNGPGYRCSCIKGYTGNPYVADGCEDINECEDPRMNSCSDICTNTKGNFNCSCPSGTYGDGLKAGKGCIKDVKRFPLLHVILGCGLGFLFLLLCCFLLYRFLMERRLIIRENFFEQNGGLIMQKIILSQHGATQVAKIFTEKVLKKATENYSEKHVLGEGAYGTVYKGTLPDQTIVAIKKSKIEDKKQLEQFVNEIVILSQLNHRNVVRIVGCCLESQVPLLVYEYIPNGTLFYHIHDQVFSLSWQARLRIATEIANGISYLHSFPIRQIVHRDIKSSNILLDHDYTVKVSDFGISRITPLDGHELVTNLQGTRGYMDPEIFESGQLTMQSDVYSFGVVLAELLTGKKHIFKVNNVAVNLAIYIVDSIKANRLFEVLEPRVRDEGNPLELLKIGNLTKACLRPKGVQRPSMREVVTELTKLRAAHTPIMSSFTRDVQCGDSTHSSNNTCSSTSQTVDRNDERTEVQTGTITWNSNMSNLS